MNLPGSYRTALRTEIVISDLPLPALRAASELMNETTAAVSVAVRRVTVA